MSSTPGSPLRHRNFRLLLAGATVNSLGNALTPVALAFAVLDLGGSATQLGFVIGAFALAEVLTTVFGGVLGDRVPRKIMMEGSNAASAVCQGVIAASLLGGWSSLGLLTAMGMVGGVVGALGGPSSSAMTPLTVPEELVPGAVTLRRLGSNTASIIGFAAAGVLVAAFGSGWAIALDALTFAFAAACFSGLRVPPLPVQRGESLLRGVAVGAREVFAHTWLWVLIGQALLYHLVYGGAQGVLGPIVVGEQFGRAAWGWALSALMVGFVCGGLLTLRWRPQRALRVGVVALGLTGAFPVAMALSPTLVWVLAGAFLHGLGLEIFSVWWDVSIQQEVPVEKLARVYSFDALGSFLMRPLGLAATGAVAGALGNSRWLLVVGLTMTVTSWLTLAVPNIRGLRRR